MDVKIIVGVHGLRIANIDDLRQAYLEITIHGENQIGEVHARSWVFSGTSSGRTNPYVVITHGKTREKLAQLTRKSCR